jgi:hypothetical protein
MKTVGVSRAPPILDDYHGLGELAPWRRPRETSDFTWSAVNLVLTTKIWAVGQALFALEID